MVSYFKTQWGKLLCGLMCIIYAFVIICTSTETGESVESISNLLAEISSIILWFIAGCNWFIISFASHNEECIRELDKRVSQLENRSITDK